MNKNILLMGKSKPVFVKALKWCTQNGFDPIFVVTQDEFYVQSMIPNTKINFVSEKYIYEEIEKKNKNFDYDKKIDEIEFVVSMLYWKKIRNKLIDFSKGNCINFHPAPLPRYRGLGGYAFAIMDKLSSWGVTAHFIDESIDTGDIIDILSFEISVNVYALDLEKETMSYLFLLFKKVMSNISRNVKLSRKKQGNGCYVNLEKLENSKFVKNSDSEELISRKIRAFWFPPYYGAKIVVNDKVYTIVDEETIKKIHQKEENTKKKQV